MTILQAHIYLNWKRKLSSVPSGTYTVKPLAPQKDTNILMKQQGKGSVDFLKGDGDVIGVF
jgi:hypothetical protein